MCVWLSFKELFEYNHTTDEFISFCSQPTHCICFLLNINRIFSVDWSVLFCWGKMKKKMHLLILWLFGIIINLFKTGVYFYTLLALSSLSFGLCETVCACVYLCMGSILFYIYDYYKIKYIYCFHRYIFHSMCLCVMVFIASTFVFVYYFEYIQYILTYVSRVAINWISMCVTVSRTTNKNNFQ